MNKFINNNLRLRGTSLAVASVLTIMSFSANAIDADSSANAGPLGASAAAATGPSASAGTSNSQTDNPSASAVATGSNGNDTASDRDGSAAAAAVELINDRGFVGADAESVIESDLNNDLETTSSNETASATASANVSSDTDYSSYAGAAVSEARSIVGNKTLNNSGGAALLLDSIANSSSAANIVTFDDDISIGNTDAQAASAAATAAFSSAIIKNNTINTTGSVNSLGQGILLNVESNATATATATASASAEDNGLGSSRSATAYAAADAETYSEAVVESNIINNSGTVNAVDASIEIRAESDAISFATAVENDIDSFDNASIDTDSIAKSSILSNIISNSGRLNSSSGAGILLFSDAFANDDERNDSVAQSFISNNTITNSGSIDADSSGISLQSWSAVGQSDNSIAEATINDNTILNTGTIIVRDVSLLGAGIDIRAVSGFSGAPLTANSYVTGNTITNRGTIAVSGITTPSLASDLSGFGADGIRLRAFGTESGLASDASVSGNTITNTGLIYAEDDGIELSAVHSVENAALVENNTIDNIYGGRIVSKDVGIKIFSDGNVRDNTIRNSGLIVSDTGMSLDGVNLIKSNSQDFVDLNPIGTAILVRSFNNASDETVNNNQLILNAPSYLAGTILLDRNAGVDVTLNSGVSHSVRWAIQNDVAPEELGTDAQFGQQDQNNNYSWAGGSQTRALLTGPNPWFVNEGVTDINGVRNDIYATIDPSAFSAAANMLADLSGMVSTMSRIGMSQTGQKNGMWVSGNGTRMNYDGDNRATMDQDTRLMAGSVGYTHHFEGFKAGVMAGYSNAELQVGSLYRDLYRHSHDNDIRGGFAGLHLNSDIGWVNVNVGLSGGSLKHDDKRFVNDNLKWWGASYAKADYDSTWYSPELTLAVPFEAAEGLTITPNVHFQYTRQNIDSYSEKGSDSNARVSSRDISVSEVKAGFDVTKTIGMARFTGRVGYLNRNSHGDNSVRVSMIGDTQNVSFFYQDINAVYLGAGVNVNLGERVDFFLSGNYLTGKDFDNAGNVTGMLRFKY